STIPTVRFIARIVASERLTRSMIRSAPVGRGGRDALHGDRAVQEPGRQGHRAAALTTTFTDLVGCSLPLQQAPMGVVALVDLVHRGGALAAVRVGTRFVAAAESGAHPAYARALIAATAED